VPHRSHLRGRPTPRTPEGERELVEGDVACFVRGAAGVHQVRNATEELVRILMLSTRIAPEVLVHPDSDKVLTKDAKDDDIFHDSVRRARRRLGRRVVVAQEGRDTRPPPGPVFGSVP
jgi:uncharacterized cupin superfamily protein